MTPKSADSLLCRITGATTAIHWLLTGQRMPEPVLNDLCSFAWTLPDTGLPWQGRNREDRAALDDLRRRKHVDVSGSTSGIHVRLTEHGAACFWFLDRAAETAADVAAMPTVSPPGMGPVTMGFELCPSAGPWWTRARATDAAWSAYLDGLRDAVTALTPLFVLGWARQFVSVDQQCWAVQLTDAGRKAVDADHPDEPSGFVFDDDAFSDGREQGKRRYGHNPPDAGSVVARMLPSSNWEARS